MNPRAGARARAHTHTHPHTHTHTHSRPPHKTPPTQYMSYGDAHEMSARVGAGLASLGLEAGDRVGICAVNSPEWMLALQVGGYRG